MLRKHFFNTYSLCIIVKSSYSIWLINVEDGIRSRFSYGVCTIYPLKSRLFFIAQYKFSSHSAISRTRSSSKKESERFNCISPSIKRTFFPADVSSNAKLAHVVDFPLPPLLFVKQIVFVLQPAIYLTMPSLLYKILFLLVDFNLKRISNTVSCFF